MTAKRLKLEELQELTKAQLIEYAGEHSIDDINSSDVKAVILIKIERTQNARQLEAFEAKITEAQANPSEIDNPIMWVTRNLDISGHGMTLSNKEGGGFIIKLNGPAMNGTWEV